MSRKWHKPNTYSHRINKKVHHTYVKLSTTIVKKYIYVTHLNFTFLQIFVSLLLTIFSFEMTYVYASSSFYPFGLTEHWNTRNKPLTPCRHKTVDFTCICFIIMSFNCSCLNRYIYSVDYKIIAQKIACLFHSKKNPK